MLTNKKIANSRLHVKGEEPTRHILSEGTLDYTADRSEA
jgi:hypothetical protein